jgi:PAS domain S-box-containing protein
MGGSVSVRLIGDAHGNPPVSAVESAFDGVDVVGEGEGTTASAPDCLVVTSTDRAERLLTATDGFDGPIVVVTDDREHPLADDGRVRVHRPDDLVTLERRVLDAVLADRERRRADARASGSIVDPTDYQELAEREAAYRALVENIPNGGVSLFDRDLRYAWVGGGVFEFIDLDPEDVVGKTVYEVHSEGFVDAYEDDYRAVFEGDRSTFEFEYDDRQFVSDLVPIREDGEVVAGMTMTRDVTEERERQRELHVKTRAMDAAAIGLCLTDPNQPDNPLVYVNEGYQQLTGYDADEVLGKNPRHLQGPETEPEPNERMREAVANAEPCAVEITNYRKDGTPFVNHVEITPIYDDEGDLVHFLGSQVDVTERHERERALERQNERLEEFASVVSHDIRSPLAVVEGNLELARETGDPSHLDEALEALDRVEEIVDDLLTLAREGRSIDPDDVGPLSVGEVARTAWSTVDTDRATLSVVDDLELPADGSRLRQLFENLFRNAIEHGSTNSRPQADDSVEHGSTGARSADDPLEVRVGALDERCGFYLEDDGPGIPGEVRDHLFEPGITSDDDGTGFGLAIVRSIAEAHDWTVEAAESESGGARFEFRARCTDGDERGPGEG